VGIPRIGLNVALQNKISKNSLRLFLFSDNYSLPEGMVAKQHVVLILFSQVPKLYLRESKIFFSSKMMNYQPQHIQKRDIVDIQKIKCNYKFKKKTSSHSIYLKNAPLKG